MRSIVVLPTYNERENLEKVVERILKAVPGIHILVVDDNSPDGTGELAEELAGRYRGRIFVLHRAKKEGLGRAYVAGFRHALAHDYDVLVQMDADLSHDPAYLRPMLQRIRECDVVLGSRYVRGINVVNWDLKRLLLSKCASLYVRLVTRMPVTDATGGFKCWRRETLEGIGLDGVFSSGYLFQVEMTYKAFRSGFGIGEEPIIFYERDLGRSKMNRRIIWEALWGVLKLRFAPRWMTHVETGGPQMDRPRHETAA
ncbi:MAG TPA: polyprenol monophosphomannose synthase [Bryobacteraceae bacterium]|nr:polyprenol monophosphomannose synthase [Bryobacteraceae bacterium]